MQDEADSKSDVPTLGRVAPHLKLEWMGSELGYVFLVVEPQLLLHVKSTVIVVKQKIVHCGSRENRTGHIETRLPDIRNNFLCVWVFEELSDLKVIDNIERISVVIVCLE